MGSHYRDLELLSVYTEEKERGAWTTYFYGEFDPGSGRTLAACLTHASRTVWCLTPNATC